MGVNVTRLGTEIDDCEDTTDWSGGASPAANSIFVLQGTNCLGDRASATTSNNILYTFPGSNPDMTGEFIVIPMLVSGEPDTIANGGYRIVVEDGSADIGTWYVGGNDTTNEKWTYFTVDPATAPTNLNGSTNTAITHSSITSSGTTVTVNATAHGLSVGDYAVIGGANEDDYNGSWPVATVPGANSFTYTADATPSASPATGTTTVFQGVDFTDVDKVGVQFKTLTTSVGSTDNVFWDVCWYGNGLTVDSTIDSVTITRSGTVATVASTAHGLSVGDKVRIAGITDKTEDNGDQTITAVLTNSYDYTTTNSGSTSYTGTITSSVHATWQHIADADAAGFWGMLVKSQGTYLAQGRIVLGSVPAAGAADLLFVDDNFRVVFRENAFLPADKNNILFAKDVVTDNIEIEMSDGLISANNTTYGIAPLEDFTVDSIQMDGMTFDNFVAVSASSDSTHNWTNCKFNAGSAVVPGAATFDNIVFNNFVPGSGGLFLGSTSVNCSNIVFKNSFGDYYTFITSHGAEFDFDNFDFQDANATDVLLLSGLADAVAVSSLTSAGTLATLTTSAAHGLSTNDWVEVAGATETEYNGFFKITVNTTTEFEYTMTGDPASPATGSPTWEEALIINNLNGSNASTYLASYGEIDFVSSVPITFEAVDKNDAAIQNVRVTAYLISDDSEVINTTTNASGLATGTFGGTTPADFYYRYRKASTGATKYVNLSGFGTIAASTGSTVKRSMSEDDIADPSI